MTPPTDGRELCTSSSLALYSTMQISVACQLLHMPRVTEGENNLPGDGRTVDNSSIWVALKSMVSGSRHLNFPGWDGKEGGHSLSPKLLCLCDTVACCIMSLLPQACDKVIEESSHGHSHGISHHSFFVEMNTQVELDELERDCSLVTESVSARRRTELPSWPIKFHIFQWRWSLSSNMTVVWHCVTFLGGHIKSWKICASWWRVSHWNWQFELAWGRGGVGGKVLPGFVTVTAREDKFWVGARGRHLCDAFFPALPWWSLHHFRCHWGYKWVLQWP